MISVTWKHLFVVMLIIQLVVTQDYEDYARRNRRRRPQQQYQQQHSPVSTGPCGRFLGLTYLNFNYNVDCGGHGGHTGGGSIDDFLGGQHGGSHGGGGQRPPKPNRPNRPFGGYGGGSPGGMQGDGQSGGGGFFNRPIWGTIGNFASNIGNTVGNTVGSFTSGFNEAGGGGGGHFFDGSIINSFTDLFSSGGGGGAGSSSSGGVPSRPPSNNYQPTTNPPTRPPPTTPSTAGLPSIEPHPVVPIVDLRPVHEEYYDEVTEASLYGSTNSKFLDTRYRYVSGSGHQQNYNSGLFDINYNKAFKKINRNINQAFNFLFRR